MAEKWSRGAAKALKRIEKNRRNELKEALKDVDREPGQAKCAGRNAAVKARINVELWRNGFEGNTALTDAEAAIRSARQLDPDDFYTNWKTAYVLKYRARGGDWDTMMRDSLTYYAQALATLRKTNPGNVDALRSVLSDRAETFVYQSQPRVALAEMKGAPADPKQDWQDWALAFAQHQNGDYGAAITTINALLAGHPSNDLYYNDMRLLLAASQARAGDANAQRTISDFRRYRDAAGEPVWTVALELERGAFEPGSAGETHWRESLELLDAAALPR